MPNPYTKLLLVCDAAERFIAESKEPLQEIELRAALDCLLSAEDILDRGRSLRPSFAPEFDADRQAVNERMDAIRSAIFPLMQRLGKKEIMELLDYRAKQNRTRSVANHL